MISICILFTFVGCGNNKTSNDVPEASQENVAEPSESTVEPDDSEPPVSLPVFKVRTLVELHVRKGPGTNYDVVRNLPYGSVVDVYEVVKDSQYEWSRIGTDEWIANDGAWLEKYDAPASQNTEPDHGTADQGDHGYSILDAFLSKAKPYWHLGPTIEEYNAADFQYAGTEDFNGKQCYKWTTPTIVFYVETGNNPSAYVKAVVPSAVLDSTLVWENGGLSITGAIDNLYSGQELEFLNLYIKYLKNKYSFFESFHYDHQEYNRYGGGYKWLDRKSVV